MNIDIICTNCSKRVPGGIKASEGFSKTREFQDEVCRMRKGYLCGACRDRKRVDFA